VRKNHTVGRGSCLGSVRGGGVGSIGEQALLRKLVEEVPRIADNRCSRKLITPFFETELGCLPRKRLIVAHSLHYLDDSRARLMPTTMRRNASKLPEQIRILCTCRDFPDFQGLTITLIDSRSFIAR
jgi:hypothetical protein